MEEEIKVKLYSNKDIPFDELPFPNEERPEEVEEFVKRFDDDYGEDYMLDLWIDPSADIDENGKFVFNPKTQKTEMKLERIKRRKEFKEMYAKAEEEEDVETLNQLMPLRDFTGEFNDDGWNHGSK